MRKSVRLQASSPTVSWWWTWVVLASLLTGCCKSQKAQEPRELVCEPIAFFEVLEPERDAGAAPFSIERFGPEVKGGFNSLEFVDFKDDNHVQVTWNIGTDLIIESSEDLVYSPVDGLARDVDQPQNVHPMRRFFDGKSERVRFGFRSTICRQPGMDGLYVFCKHTEEELFLVADMYCRWWINGSPPEK